MTTSEPERVLATMARIFTGFHIKTLTEVDRKIVQLLTIHEFMEVDGDHVYITDAALALSKE